MFQTSSKNDIECFSNMLNINFQLPFVEYLCFDHFDLNSKNALCDNCNLMFYSVYNKDLNFTLNKINISSLNLNI